MMQRLTIVGASARAAAFSAIRAGYQPYAIDLFADRDLATVCTAAKVQPQEYADALAGAPKAPWMYTGGLENLPTLVERLASLRPLCGNAAAVLRQVRDPRQLAMAAATVGCRFPEWRPAVADADLPEFCQGGWLLKPRHSSGGKSIRFALAGRLGIVTPRTYWQKFVSGQSASAVYVADARRAVLLGATRQLLGRDFGLERQFLYAGSIGPLPLMTSESDQLVRLGNTLAERFGLAGLFNVDFIRGEPGLWVLEVNPRYSASVEILERLTPASLVALHLTACEQRGLPPGPPAMDAKFAGKAVVYAEREGSVPRAFDELIARWNLPLEPVGIADLPRIGDALSPGQPVATVFAAAATDDAVENELRSRVSEVLAVLNSENGPSTPG